MIYFFHGSDTAKARAKAFEWVAKARAKQQNLTYVRLAREDLTQAALEDAAFSGGLFAKRLLVLVDDPFPPVREEEEERQGSQDGKRAAAGILEASLDMLAASDNAILILAPGLAAAKARALAGEAKVEYKFDEAPRGGAARGFNSNLVNALAARNREKLWLEVARALRAGDTPEMLCGLLHWKARDLMEKGSRAWKPHEARALSLALISLLQDSHRSGLAAPLLLERFALSI